MTTVQSAGRHLLTRLPNTGLRWAACYGSKVLEGALRVWAPSGVRAEQQRELFRPPSPPRPSAAWTATALPHEEERLQP